MAKNNNKKNNSKKIVKKANNLGLTAVDYKSIGGDIEYDPITAGEITNPDFDFTNTDFDVDNIQAGTVTADTLANRFMTAADYAMVDPEEIARRYGEINRSETQANANLASDIALQTLDTELQGLQNYTPAAAALKRAELAKDQTFNQAQRDAGLDAGDSTIRSDLMSQADRARAYASGSLPDSIQNLGLELGIRSRAAEGAAAGGFGVASGAALKNAALMSAEQRLAISQYGDQLLSSNIANRYSTLVAPTVMSDAGAQIQVNPTVSAGQLMTQSASEMNAGNITAKDALGNLTQQAQFETEINQDTNKTNFAAQTARDLNQAQLNLTASSTNVSNALQADITNAGNKLQAQTAGAQIASNEKQFVAQLDWNTQNTNVANKLSADQINASNALKVAESNRATKLQIDQSNASMVNSEISRQRSEAAANARASMAAGASRYAADLSYKANQESLAVQLQQQKDALEVYERNRGKGESNANAAAGANMITQIPTIISGVTGIIDSVSGIFTDDSTPAKGEAIGQNTDGSYIYY